MDVRRVSAILLILCFVVFTVGGILYSGRAFLKWPAARTDSYLVWERGIIIAAAVINLLGFVLLESMLRDAGDTLITRLALAVYLLATGLMLAAEGSLLNNREMVYPQIVLYVVLAFLAQAAFGVALVQTGLVPTWVGWTTIAWNLAWLVIMPIASPKDIYFPVLHHVAPLLLGIVLLAR